MMYLLVSYKKKIRKIIYYKILKVIEESSLIRSRIWIQEPDPHQNVTDPQHWLTIQYFLLMLSEKNLFAFCLTVC
jgi:hypothetical protein